MLVSLVIVYLIYINFSNIYEHFYSQLYKIIAFSIFYAQGSVGVFNFCNHYRQHLSCDCIEIIHTVGFLNPTQAALRLRLYGMSMPFY